MLYVWPVADNFGLVLDSHDYSISPFEPFSESKIFTATSDLLTVKRALLICLYMIKNNSASPLCIRYF